MPWDVGVGGFVDEKRGWGGDAKGDDGGWVVGVSQDDELALGTGCFAEYVA